MKHSGAFNSKNDIIGRDVSSTVVENDSSMACRSNGVAIQNDGVRTISVN